MGIDEPALKVGRMGVPNAFAVGRRGAGVVVLSESLLALIHEVGTHEEAPKLDSSTAAMCIFGGKRGLLATLFATNPPMEKRIERLRSR